MSDDFNQETGDVSNVESTASSEASSSPEPQSAAPTQEASPGAEKPTPFHEHPRFQELIEQNKQYRLYQEQQAQMMQDMRSRLEAMQQAKQESPKSTQPSYEQLVARLKGIDPEFAGLQEKVLKDLENLPTVQKELQEFKQWKDSMDMENTRKEASGKLESLYTQYKVPQELREDYEMRIRMAAQANPKLGVKDLDQVFKSTHEAVTKRYEDFRRKERESYQQSKTKDKTPATQTGGTPAKIPGAKTSSFEDRVSLVANALKASKQI